MQEEAELPQEGQNEEAVADAPKWSPKAEQEARAFGWKPADEWQGDLPGGFIEDPERYLERAEGFYPFRKLKEQMEKQSEVQQQELRKIASVAEQVIQGEKERMRAELDANRAAQDRAADDGDMTRFRELRKEEDSLRDKITPEDPKAPDDNGVPDNHRRAIERWSVGKDWFKTDQVLTNNASMFYGEAQQKGLTDPEAILKHVDMRMAEAFPHKFGEKPKQPPVESGLNFGGSPGGDGGFSKLPKAAKDAFKDFASRGWFEDNAEGRKKYMESYNAYG